MKNLKKIAALVLGITIFTGTFQVSAKSSEIIFKLVSKSGNASESGDASISGNASISGDASISGNASESGDASISGNASESGNSSISGNAGNSEKFNDVISLNNYDYSNEVSGSKSIYTCIHNYLSEAKNEVLKEYKNYYKSGFKEYKSSKYILSTYNYRQRELNQYYLSEYGSHINDTCSLVSSTIMAEYYSRRGYAITLRHSKYKKIFATMVNLGFGTGAYRHGYGTTNSKLSKVLSAYYDIYKKYLDGEYILTSLNDKISSYNRICKPVIGHFKAPNGDGHDMVIVGYYDIKISYQKYKNSGKYLKTTRFYVVNDGWHYSIGGSGRVQYINAKYLKGITRLR